MQTNPAVRAAIVVAGLSLLGPAVAGAQGDCRTRDVNPCTDNPPAAFVAITPPTAPGSSIQITVDWSDDFGINPATRAVYVNGSVATETSFAFSSYPKHATSVVNVPWTSGTVAVTAQISDVPYLGAQAQTSNGYGTYTPPPPPPPLQVHAVPTVSLAPHHADFRDVAQGSAVLGYSTPAYVSRDQSHSVSLMYASGQAAPVGFVQVDATDNSSSADTAMSIRVKDASGTWVTPETFYRAGHGTYRLAAQWDAHSLATGAYTYSVVVRTYFSDGTMTESPVHSVRVLVANASGLTLGVGWSIAGLQRIWNSQSGSFVVLEESGTVKYFPFPYCLPDAQGYQVCYATSPAGDVTKLTYQYRDNTYVRRYPDGSKVIFSSDGRQLYADDRFGNRTTFAWRWTTGTSPILVPDIVTDPAGKSIVFGYDTGWKMNSISDPMSRQTLLYYAANGTDLQSISAPDGSVALSVGYDGNHRAGQWVESGHAWNFNYAADGSLASLVSPAVRTTAGSTSLTSRYTSLATAVLPAAGRGLAGQAPADSVPSAKVRVVTIGPAGDTTRVAVDRYGLPTRVDAPAGLWATYLRDSSGNPLSVRTSRGDSIDMQWDTLGHTVRQVNLVTGEDAGTSYDPNTGLLLGQTAAGFMVTRYYYDPAGHLSKQTAGTDTAALVRYTWDATTSRLLTVWTRNGQTTRYFFGSAGLQNTDSVRVQDALGTRSTRARYDTYGRTTWTQNAAGDTASFGYDLLNRRRSSGGGAGGTTLFGYPSADVVTVTDAAGKVFTDSLNALGWVNARLDPTGRMAYGYDEAGNPVSFTNRRGQSVSATYYADGRIHTQTLPGGATTTWAYDAAGRWMTVKNAASSDSLVYDAAGRLTERVTVRGSRTYDLKSTYSEQGGRTKLELIQPGQATRTAQWVYNGLGQLQSVVNLAGLATDLSYNPAGLDTAITHSTGLREYLRWSSDGRQTFSDYNTYAVSQALGWSATLDPVSRVGFVANSRQDTLNYFAFDHSGRLKGATRTHAYMVYECTDPQYDYTCSNNQYEDIVADAAYTYDLVGNRTDGATLQAGTNRYATFNGFTLGYDADGNLTSKSSWGMAQNFYWNALGQLDSVKLGTTVTRYGYDGLGMRTRAVTANGATVTSDVSYLYDGANLLAELDASGNIVREYSYYPGVDQPHSMDVATGGGTWATYYYAMDPAGNVAGLTNSANQVVNTYKYEPFGAASLNGFAEQVYNPLRFKAREQDPNTGVYYMRARWYDPDLGRFISEDPIGIDGGINTYAFAGNDPINASDPMGLDPQGCFPIDVFQQLPVPPGIVEYLASLGLKVCLGTIQEHIRVPGFTEPAEGNIMLSDAMLPLAADLYNRRPPGWQKTIEGWVHAGGPYVTVIGAPQVPADLRPPSYFVREQCMNKTWYDNNKVAAGLTASALIGGPTVTRLAKAGTGVTTVSQSYFLGEEFPAGGAIGAQGAIVGAFYVEQFGVMVSTLVQCGLTNPTH